MMTDIQKAASALGKKGGRSRTPAKVAAARENGKRGGRPSLVSMVQQLEEQARPMYLELMSSGRVYTVESPHKDAMWHSGQELDRAIARKVLDGLGREV